MIKPVFPLYILHFIFVCGVNAVFRKHGITWDTLDWWLVWGLLGLLMGISQIIAVESGWWK